MRMCEKCQKDVADYPSIWCDECQKPIKKVKYYRPYRKLNSRIRVIFKKEP